MEVPFLLTSTLTDDTRVSVVTNKTCLLCVWKYFYRPIRSLYTLRGSIDTFEEEKTMDFITVLILEHIKEIGVGRVFHGRDGVK